MIVVPRDIRVQTVKPKSLEEMGLPQIADVVVNTAAFAPMGHRPNIAGKNGKEDETAKSLQIFHRIPASCARTGRWNNRLLDSARDHNIQAQLTSRGKRTTP
jgi:hypothetical protein